MKKDIRPGQYIYSYDYEPNQNWSRVEVSDADRAERLNSFMNNADVQNEIKDTVDKVYKFVSCNSEQSTASNKLIFTVLSDTHYVNNGNWEYTAATIETVNDSIAEKLGRKVDGIIHLGDFTDGILSKEVCRDYSHRVIDKMLSWSLPVYVCTGNHDCNYFKQNPEKLSMNEQYEMYLADVLDATSDMNVEVHVWGDEVADEVTGEKVYTNKLYYRADIHDKKLVILALDAYDNTEKNRYGFTEEEIDWMSQEFENVPDDYKVLIISHDAPLAKLDFWAQEIRNGENLCDVLDAWNMEHDHRILAFLHGHTHADRIFYDRSFPIISVGSSKVEYSEDRKPFGAIPAVRYEDDVTQELWDTMIIDMETGELQLVRFGAGFDRMVPGVPEMIKRTSSNRYRCMSRYIDHPFVWGHRGASGYAPENTLESFMLADKLGADGIELDVQFTRDRELVVIHDEWINRTSDGQGAVADLTLAELRKYNFNNKMLGMPWCDIPTLREVLEFVKTTRMVINIELKTSVNYYPGIEEAVVNLVDEYDMADRIIYSSFNHDSVMRVKKLRPSAECGLLYNIGIANASSYAKNLGVEALHPGLNSMMYPGFIEDCRNQGIKINTWTANSFSEIEKMRQYGINALITNYPDRAFELFEKVDLSTIVDEFKVEMACRNAAENKNKSKGMTGKEAATSKGSRSKALHLVGVTYSKIKKVCIKIDNKVQKMAGYR